MSDAASPFFLYEDDPDAPGWKRWQFRDPTRFNAFLEPLLVKVEDGQARVRMMPCSEPEGSLRWQAPNSA